MASQFVPPSDPRTLDALGAEWPTHQLVLRVKDNNHVVPVPDVGLWDLRGDTDEECQRRKRRAGCQQGRGGVGGGWNSGLPNLAVEEGRGGFLLPSLLLCQRGRS